MAAQKSKSKKGLTPIISVILLLMMAVSTAAGMFYWLSRVQGQQQGSIESFQSGLFEDLASAVDVVDADYNDTSQLLDMFFQNTGNTQITIDNASAAPTTEWILFDANQKAICSTNWLGASNAPSCVRGCGTASLIEIGQLKRVTLNLGSSDCAIRNQANGTVLSFIVNFSGKTTTSGSFVK